MNTATATQTTATPTANCLRCGRTLTSAKSVANKYGRTCRTNIRKAAETAALADFKPEQIAKAREAIEQGAAIPTRRPNVFQLVASKGDVSYLSAVQACNCPAGLRAGRCYHRAVVVILTLAA